MTDAPAQPKISANDILRFVLELFTFVSLGLWGFLAWPLPWPGILIGIGAPVLAILAWALFRSPKAVFHLDPFGKAVIEICVMGAAAFAWWDLGQPIVAVVFAVIAAISGLIAGRKELS